MIAVDTNILVYAAVRDFPRHASARRRLAALAEGAAPWGIPVFCVAEFLRVLTHRAILGAPRTPAQAWDWLGRLLGAPTLQVLLPAERFLPLFEEAVRASGAAGNLIFDAQIVALCREHGVTGLLTDDRDFDRFPGLSVLHLGDTPV